MLQAIALHNLFTVEKVEIDFIESHIDFLLVLCDEAQEWGRWLINDKTKEFFVPIEEIKWELTDKTFKVKMDFHGKSEEIKENMPDFNVEKLVKNKFCNLKRLKVSSVPGLDIEIEFLIVDFNGKESKISLSSPLYTWEETHEY